MADISNPSRIYPRLSEINHSLSNCRPHDCPLRSASFFFALLCLPLFESITPPCRQISLQSELPDGRIKRASAVANEKLVASWTPMRWALISVVCDAGGSGKNVILQQSGRRNPSAVRDNYLVPLTPQRNPSEGHLSRRERPPANLDVNPRQIL